MNPELFNPSALAMLYDADLLSNPADDHHFAYFHQGDYVACPNNNFTSFHHPMPPPPVPQHCTTWATRTQSPITISNTNTANSFSSAHTTHPLRREGFTPEHVFIPEFCDIAGTWDFLENVPALPPCNPLPWSLPELPLDMSTETQAWQCHRPGTADSDISIGSSTSTKSDHRPQRARNIPCLHPTCQRMFTTEYTRRVHMSTHIPRPAKQFPCLMGCKEVFGRSHDRLRHEVATHGKQCEWVCRSCLRFFGSERMMESHKCKGIASATRDRATPSVCSSTP